MKNKIFFSAIAIFIVFTSFAFFVNGSILESLRNTFTIINGTASFITVVIAILLYNKYGVDKTIKEKNLEISLKLLEDLKKMRIRFMGKNFGCIYRPGTSSFEYLEPFYSSKILFPETYFEDLDFLNKYSLNLYLPKEIKTRIDILIPSVMSSDVPEEKRSDYAKVVIIGGKENKWICNIVNGEKETTIYEYFIKWDELITTIHTWLKNNSTDRIDLNIN